MTTFQNINTQSSISQMISEAAYKVVLLVERMFQSR